VLPSPNGAAISAAARSVLVLDGRLRPSIEDLIGAGAVIEALGLPCSPEAVITGEIFCSVRSRLRELLRSCVSGQELINRGYAQDVEVAIDLNTSIAAPLLENCAYIG
jgi:2-phosphosulfolactate phosphatase